MNTITETGVLLVNLGTPAEPTPAAVGNFLDEFLSDSRVIDLPRWLWLPLLRRIILPRRSGPVSEAYRHLWQQWGDSPLRIITEKQVSGLQQRLPACRVAHAFTYGEPGLSQVLTQMRQAGLRRIVILPLYPQYSTTTTAAVADRLNAWQAQNSDVRCTLIEHYADAPLFIEALKQSVQHFWSEHGKGDRLLLSFHGIPQRYADRGDPYPQQCRKTADLLAKTLSLSPDQYGMAYQSRFGRAQWVKPYTLNVLQAWAREGVPCVDVLCPSFSADCLETLEEIALMADRYFREAGGERLRLIPCLNADEAHLKMMQDLVEQSL